MFGERLELLGDEVHAAINEVVDLGLTGFLPIWATALRNGARPELVLAVFGWMPKDRHCDRYTRFDETGPALILDDFHEEALRLFLSLRDVDYKPAWRIVR